MSIVQVKVYNSVYEVDTESDPIKTIKEPDFLQKVWWRKREHFRAHKGCLVDSYTLTGTGWKERYHVAYLVDCKTGGTFCLGNGSSIRKACGIIDRVLDTGEYRKGD